MSNKALNVRSPSKENCSNGLMLSPSQGISPAKIRELYQFLEAHNISVPAHLDFCCFTAKNLIDSEFKSKASLPALKTNLNSQVKNLKIKLVDAEFQLKKIQEDFAQYKRNTKIQKDKDSKKIEELTLKLKQQSQQSEQDKDFLRNKIVSNYQKQIQDLKSKMKLQTDNKKSQICLQYDQKIKRITEDHVKALEQLEYEKNISYASMEKKMENQIAKIRQQHQNERHDILLRNKQKMETKQKNFDSVLTAIQSQKRTQQRMHEKTKVQAQREKQKIIGELCFQKNLKQNLEDQLVEKNKQIRLLNSKISDLRIQLRTSKEQQEHAKELTAQQHRTEISQIHARYQKKLQQCLSRNAECIEAFQQKIEELQQIQSNTQELNEEKLLSLSCKFQERPSKQVDLQEIKRLAELVTKKDKQIKKLSQELKYRKLQIENKEEVYNKIFRSSHPSRAAKDERMKEERSRGVPHIQKALQSLSKVDGSNGQSERENLRSKQNLFRKSHTTNIKMFLNAYSHSPSPTMTKRGGL